MKKIIKVNILIKIFKIVFLVKFDGHVRDNWLTEP
jgi:hypothetical protein